MVNPTPKNKKQNGISNSENAMNNSQMGNIGGNVQFGNNITHNNYTNLLENLTEKQKKELEKKKDERLKMLNALEERYKERLSKKMEGENLKIEFEPKYTKVGTTQDYRNIVLNHYHEGKTVNTNTLYNDFLKKKQLLIIGEAGSGKTVLLLTIAQKLIAEAKNRIANNDTSYPYPILLNLATWTTKDKCTFKDWLKENLVYAAGRSGVSKKYAKELTEENNMILFLDGLDEISENDRKSCVDAMKNYFKEKSRNNSSQFPEGIICCRKNEYLRLKQDLPIRAITEIVPLTLGKIKQQLKIKNITDANILLEIIEQNEQAIKKAKYLTAVFEVNIALSLAQNYLLYDFKLDKLETQNLIDIYINQEIKKVEEYEPQKTKHYLSSLAQNLQESKKGITFELTDIQTNWAKTHFKNIYRIFLFILIFATTFVSFNDFYNFSQNTVKSFVILVLGSIFSYIIGASYILFVGFLILAFVLFIVWVFITISESFDEDNTDKKPMKKSSFIELFLGISLVAFLFSLYYIFVRNKIDYDEQKRISFKNVILNLGRTLFYIFIYILMFLPIYYLLGFEYNLLLGFLTGVIAGIIMGLYDDLSVNKVLKPYQKMPFFPLNRIIHWMFFALLFSLVEHNLNYSMSIEDIFEIISKTIFLTFTMTIIHSSRIQHILLCAIIYIEKKLPFRILFFLNKVSQTGLMEKDGGQWRFRHQLIQDRLAGKEIKKN